MADFSLIEFIVYGLVGYGGLIFAMATVLQNPPSDRSWAAIRAVVIIPSIICLGVLMYASGNITTEYHDTTTTEIGYNVSQTNDIITNVTTTTNTTDKFILVDPVWASIHFMFFILLILIFIIQIFNTLTKT